MTKEECEKAVRYLCHEWARETGADQQNPSFTDFMAWLRRHHPQHLNFRSTGGAAGAIERWFNLEFRQGWRD